MTYIVDMLFGCGRLIDGNKRVVDAGVWTVLKSR
jgi:hypothetical protein